MVMDGNADEKDDEDDEAAHSVTFGLFMIW